MVEGIAQQLGIQIEGKLVAVRILSEIAGTDGGPGHPAQAFHPVLLLEKKNLRVLQAPPPSWPAWEARSIDGDDEAISRQVEAGKSTADFLEEPARTVAAVYERDAAEIGEDPNPARPFTIALDGNRSATS